MDSVGPGGGPTCTEGSDVLVHLEADDGAVVVDDVRLSVPGTAHHLLQPVALRETGEKAAGVSGSPFGKRPNDGAGGHGVDGLVTATRKANCHTFPTECLAGATSYNTHNHPVRQVTLLPALTPRKREFLETKVTHPRSHIWGVVEPGRFCTTEHA